MRTSTILAATTSLLPLTNARIGGIGVPPTIKPGSTFDIIIEGTGYIQSVTDVSLAVGYFPGAAPAGDGLGIFITAFDLGEFFYPGAWMASWVCCNAPCVLICGD